MAGEIRGSGVGLPVQNEIIAQSTVSVIDQNGYEIGYLQNFNPTMNRPVTPQRAIGAANAGRIVEMTPGPENYTASVSGFVLYAKDSTHRRSLLNRVGGSAHDAYTVLADQTEPFYVYLKAGHPATEALVGKDPNDSGYLFGGGWFTSQNMTFNITQGGNSVSSSCNLTFQWVEAIQGSADTSTS